MKRSILYDHYGRSRITKAIELLMCLIVWAIPLTCAHYIDTKLYAADTQLARMTVTTVGGAGASAVGVTCNTRDNTPVVEYTSNENTETVIDTARGAKFATGTAINLYSIAFYLVTTSGNETLTMRYGTTTDLNTYLGTKVVSITTANNASWIEFVYKDVTNTLNGTYYAGWESTGASAVAIGMGYPAAGTGNQYAYGTGWALGAANTSVSYMIRVYKCAD